MRAWTLGAPVSRIIFGQAATHLLVNSRWKVLAHQPKDLNFVRFKKLLKLLRYLLM